MIEPLTDESELSVSPLELFFDLVFVFAITQIAGLMRNDLTPGGIAKAALVLAMIYWGWSMFTWTLNAVGTARLVVRLGLLAAMAMSLLMARVIPDAYGDGGPYFALAYFVFRVVANVVALRADDPDRRRVQWTFFPLATLGGLVALVGGFVPEPGRVWIWLGSMLVDLVSARAAERGDWQIRPGHFAERYGLLVIIALGESIVAIGVGIGEVEVDIELGVTLVIAFVATAVLWWSYFDWLAARVEEHLRRLSGTERGAYARDAYTLLHYPLVGGIVLFAVVVEEIAGHPTAALDGSARTLLAAGIALVLLSLAASAYRSLRRIPYLRLSAVGLVALLSFAGGSLDGVMLLGLDSAVVVAMLVGERVGHRRPAVSLTATGRPETG